MNDFATWISIVAALIALLSAMYARSQVREAREGNRLTIHSNRLQQYTTLLRISRGIVDANARIHSHSIEELKDCACLCEFYFPKKIYEELFSYFIELNSLYDEIPHSNDYREKDDFFKVAKAEHREKAYELERKLRKFSRKMKPHLVVGNS